MVLVFWISFVLGMIVTSAAKNIFKYCLAIKYTEDTVKNMEPLWSNWNLICIIISGAFVLLFYIGKLFS